MSALALFRLHAFNYVSGQGKTIDNYLPLTFHGNDIICVLWLLVVGKRNLSRLCIMTARKISLLDFFQSKDYIARIRDGQSCRLFQGRW